MYAATHKQRNALHLNRLRQGRKVVPISEWFKNQGTDLKWLEQKLDT